jgi:15-cis-phytoene synthase
MNHSNPIIDQSYQYCHAVARRAGSSFYPCFIVLPGPQRRAMEAIYAFMRHTDDLGDQPPSPDDPVSRQLAALDAWRTALDEALLAPPAAHGPPPTAHGPRPTAHCLPALADTVHRFNISPEHFHAVIDGVEMDLRGRSYETFDQLAEYCHRVASAVGLACIRVWGFRGDEPTEPARACGLAFQLTNILRDLKEDAARGRIYLPQEDLRQCGYSPESLARGETGPSFRRLMELEIGRAKTFYHEGAALFDHLERPGQRILGMMLGVYHRLLCQIDRDPTAVLTRRLRVGRLDRLRLAGRWLLLPPARRDLP